MQWHTTRRLNRDNSLVKPSAGGLGEFECGHIVGFSCGARSALPRFILSSEFDLCVELGTPSTSRKGLLSRLLVRNDLNRP